MTNPTLTIYSDYCVLSGCNSSIINTTAAALTDNSSAVDSFVSGLSLGVTQPSSNISPSTTLINVTGGQPYFENGDSLANVETVLLALFEAGLCSNNLSVVLRSDMLASSAFGGVLP